jgi:hypothetical protein
MSYITCGKYFTGNLKYFTGNVKLLIARSDRHEKKEHEECQAEYHRIR